MISKSSKSKKREGDFEDADNLKFDPPFVSRDANPAWNRGTERQREDFKLMGPPMEAVSLAPPLNCLMDVPRNDECDLLRRGKHAHDTEIQGAYRFARSQTRRVQEPSVKNLRALAAESRVFNEIQQTTQ
ncbi:hypothetical protein K0M31_002431 [Melipona bicolor]|uniref:Uncharacterized protein n=1 Tax=Melipona bicolor TaxID=60889 RepID=A0AA40GHP9_9HYME|nr:hypothetical protein K0M31_002431 [Melipona bicolor]